MTPRELSRRPWPELCGRIDGPAEATVDVVVGRVGPHVALAIVETDTATGLDVEVTSVLADPAQARAAALALLDSARKAELAAQEFRQASACRGK